MILFFVISSLLLGCSNNETNLEEVKGVGLTYSEYFKNLDELDRRDNIKYYKPLPIDEIELLPLPEQVKKSVNAIVSDRLPFKVDEEKAYLVTSENENGEVMNQMQLSYHGNVDDFFIISVTEVDGNPLEGYNVSDEYDSVGNELKKEVLAEGVPIYQQVITTNGALLYSYYDYDKTENRVNTVGTTANEFYAYYNGYVYHIGYLIDRKKNDKKMQENMLQLTRDYILRNSL